LTEGIVTIVVAFFAYFIITDCPEKAKWLNDKERKVAIERLKNDSGKAYVIHFDNRQLFAALKDWVRKKIR
jgi:hypothetical protein